MTIQFDGQTSGTIDTETWLGVMEKEAVILHDSAVQFRVDGLLDYAQMSLLEEIAIRMEMICLILRGGIDGKKEE